MIEVGSIVRKRVSFPVEHLGVKCRVAEIDDDTARVQYDGPYSTKVRVPLDQLVLAETEEQS